LPLFFYFSIAARKIKNVFMGVEVVQRILYTAPKNFFLIGILRRVVYGFIKGQIPQF
jgi:hypothetical protein